MAAQPYWWLGIVIPIGILALWFGGGWLLVWWVERDPTGRRGRGL